MTQVMKGVRVLEVAQFTFVPASETHARSHLPSFMSNVRFVVPPPAACE